MKKIKYILFSLLFLAIFIPSFTMAQEQEHQYWGSVEYYSEDVNHPISYNSGFKTDDGSYGLFTLYYDKSDVRSFLGSSLSNFDTYLDSSKHNLFKVVFTPIREDLAVGELTSIDEFYGYIPLTYRGNSEVTAFDNIIMNNFGSSDDYIHIRYNSLWYTHSDSSAIYYILIHTSDSSSESGIVLFNMIDQSFYYGSKKIYPNLENGQYYDFDITYRKSTGEFTFSVNGETLSYIDTSLTLADYPLLYINYTSIYFGTDFYYSRNNFVRYLTIDDGNGKSITLYPAIYRTSETGYYWTVSYFSTDGEEASTYFLSHDYVHYGSYSYFYNLPSTGDIPSGGSSGSGGGSGTITNDNFYKRIYPPQNNNSIADWVTRIRSTYERLGKQHLALYMTRYNKELDALYGYYILWDPSDASTLGNIAYNLNSDNTISITLSDDITTNFALTTVFDHDLLNNYTPVEAGAVGEDLLNYKNWNTYNSLYLSPNDIGLFGSIFGSTDFINFGSNIFGIKKYTYSDLEIDKTLTLSPITTNKNDIYGNPLTFYAAVSSTDKYNDYYVLLNLSDGINSNVKDIYNSAWYKDNETGEPVMSYYSVMPYLNINFSFAGTENETTIIGTPSEDFDYSDTSYGKYGDDIKEAIKSEDEMKALSPIMILSENLSSLTDLLMGLTNDVSSIFYQINDNSTYYYTYLESLSDTNLITTGSFMSGELQWIYDNTPFNVPVNIGLCTSLVMAVIF